MTGDWIILDTNIVSYLMKGAREARLYETHVRERLLAISFITVGEFYYGAEKNNWGEKKRKWEGVRLAEKRTENELAEAGRAILTRP